MRTCFEEIYILVNKWLDKVRSVGSICSKNYTCYNIWHNKKNGIKLWSIGKIWTAWVGIYHLCEFIITMGTNSKRSYYFLADHNSEVNTTHFFLQQTHFCIVYRSTGLKSKKFNNWFNAIVLRHANLFALWHPPI